MVRINLIEPRKLADQHLIAEYNEILMLFGYVKKFPAQEGIPERYCLGPGHIRFFKDKLFYLKERHELIKKEMQDRSFKATRTIALARFPQALKNNWTPETEDYEIIKQRLRQKIALKPEWYRYYGKQATQDLLFDLLK